MSAVAEAAQTAPQASGRGERGAMRAQAWDRWLTLAREKGLQAWRLVQQNRGLARRARRLRVSETVSLGNKRFVSILEVDGQAFLIGCGEGSVSLLASLPRQDTPAQEKQWADGQAAPAGQPPFQQVLGQAWDHSA